MLKHTQWIWEFARNRWHEATGVRHERRTEFRGLAAAACVESLETRNLLAANSAGFQIPANPDPLRSLGPQSTLVVQVDLKLDASWDPAEYREYESSEIRLAYSRVNDFYTRQSFGKLTFPDDRLTIVGDTIELPYTLRQMETASNGPDRIVKVVDTKLRALGYDLKDYQHLTIIHPYLEGKSFNYAGLGMTPGHLLLINSILDPEVWAHELGHNAGVPHTGVFDAKDPNQVIADPKQMKFLEERTGMDIMDTYELVGMDAQGRNGDFFALRKAQLGWLDLGTNVVNVTNSGRFQLFATDDGTEQDDRIYALRIRRNATQEYWLEYRANTDFDSLDNGVVVTLHNYAAGKKGGEKMLGLLDMTPETDAALSDYYFMDTTLEVSHTFDDFASKVRITPVTTSFANGSHVIDVVVSVGDEPNNHAPTATITVDKLTVGVQENVQFHAELHDVDGDHLTYFWQFGDYSFVENTLNPTHNWYGVGEQLVRLVVNDGHGGISEFVKVVTVGEPRTVSIAHLPELDRIPNKATNGEQRDAVVASDGQTQSVVVWINPATENRQSIGTVVAQRFDGTNPVGPLIVVGKSFGEDLQPSVAMTREGEFVVSWKGRPTADGDEAILARKFSAAGKPQGDAVIVTTGDGLNAANVSIANDGRQFVVVWTKNLIPQFRTFNALGVAITGVQSIPLGEGNTPAGNYAAIAMSVSGEFVVAWVAKSPNPYVDWYRVIAQRFHANSQANGAPLILADNELEPATKLSVAFAPDDSFSVVFGRRERLSNGWSPQIRFVTVRNDETILGPKELESNANVVFPMNPTLIIDPDGRRIVTWLSRNTDSPKIGYLLTLVYSDSGEKLAEEITGSRSQSSSIAFLEDISNVVVATAESEYDSQDLTGPAPEFDPLVRFFGMADASSVVAQPDSGVTTPDKTVSVDVIRNDTNLLSGPLKLSLPFGPRFGTVKIDQNKSPKDFSDDRLVFTPAPGFRGIQEIAYQVTNSLGATSTGMLRVEVGNSDSSPTVSAPPIGVADSFTTKEDTILKVVGNGVLKNDSQTTPGKLSAELATGPSHGTLTFKPNGSFVYQPAANFSGTDSFTYRVSNGKSFSELTTVTLQIAPVADKPTLSLSKSITGTVGGEIALPMTAALVDNDGSETLTLKLSGLPPTATLNHGVKLTDGTWQLTSQDLVGLKLQVSTTGKFTLKVECLAAESVGGTFAKVSAKVKAQILLADAA